MKKRCFALLYPRSNSFFDSGGHLLQIMPNLIAVLTDLCDGSVNFASNSFLIAPSRMEAKDKLICANVRLQT